MGSQGQQLEQRSPDVSVPSHFPQIFWGNPEVFPGQPRHSLSNMSWAFPGVSSQWYVPGTPHRGGVKEAF